MFGGFGAGGTTDPDDVASDLWCHDLVHWRCVSTNTGHGARYASLFSHDGKLWRFGGCGWNGKSVTFTNKIWCLNEGRRVWETVADNDSISPPERYTAAAFGYKDSIYVFGGNSQDTDRKNTYYGDLWRLSGNRWKKIHDHTIGPGKRYGFGWCASAGNLYVFGGFDGTRDCNDLWQLSVSSHCPDTVEWTKLPTKPEARYCPALGVVGNTLVLFGGRSKLNSKRNFSDTWVYTQDTTSWRRLAASAPGYHAKSAYASDGTSLMLFGGEGSHGHVSDLWRFDGRNWMCLQPACEKDPAFW
ncbi:MAG: kelch repeat-containing protein [Alphaproteobacteria bacterium]